MAGRPDDVEEQLSALGARLRQVRQGRRHSQREVADSVGSSDAAVSSYENGTRQPPIVWLRRFAEAYEADLGWLLTGAPGSAAPSILSPEGFLPTSTAAAAYVVRRAVPLCPFCDERVAEQAPRCPKCRMEIRWPEDDAEP